MKRSNLSWLILGMAGLVLLLGPLAHGAAPEIKSYETGYPTVVKLQRELHQGLEARVRKQISPDPMLLDQMFMPYLQPGEVNNGSNVLQVVAVSAGFVDLVNYLSHAKAIDAANRGFFKKYLASVALESGDRALPALETSSANKTWAFNTMNHQASHFNQIAGTLIAIDMAHHYLGHYKKYGSQLAGAPKPVSINSLLTPAEWQEAVMTGARHALDCGLGVAGLKILFDAFDQMPTRPAWAIYFVPPHVKVAKIKRDLEKLENKSFFISKE